MPASRAPGRWPRSVKCPNEPLYAPKTTKLQAAPPPEGRGRPRRGAVPLSVRGVFAQFAAQDLADVGLGQFLAELDMPGLLVAGQVLAGVGLDLLGGQAFVLLDHHQLD